MAKLIERDGKHYRMRRGKMVEIPEEWVGKTVHRQTIAKRPSKMTGKLANEVKSSGGRWKRQRKYIQTRDDE